MMLSAPKVLRVDAFSDTGVELKVLGDVKPTTQWEVMGELRRRLKIAFDAEGIHIPRLAGVVVPPQGIAETAPPQTKDVAAEGAAGEDGQV
jgi:small conductance mechanosensitive channel